jgi:hypothetical protein
MNCRYDYLGEIVSSSCNLCVGTVSFSCCNLWVLRASSSYNSWVVIASPSCKSENTLTSLFEYEVNEFLIEFNNMLKEY